MEYKWKILQRLIFIHMQSEAKYHLTWMLNVTHLSSLLKEIWSNFGDGLFPLEEAQTAKS